MQTSDADLVERVYELKCRSFRFSRRASLTDWELRFIGILLPEIGIAIPSAGNKNPVYAW
jgi:hypothetical protein